MLAMSKFPYQILPRPLTVSGCQSESWSQLRGISCWERHTQNSPLDPHALWSRKTLNAILLPLQRILLQGSGLQHPSCFLTLWQTQSKGKESAGYCAANTCSAGAMEGLHKVETNRVYLMIQAKIWQGKWWRRVINAVSPEAIMTLLQNSSALQNPSPTKRGMILGLL